MSEHQAPEQILIITAPTAVTFHVALAGRLSEIFPRTPIRFLSVYSLAVRRVRAMGWDATYLADLLRDVSGNEMTTEEYRALDERLHATCKANINLMLSADKTLPRNGRRAEDLAKKYVIALDRLIPERTLAISRMHDCFLLWLASAMTFSKAGWYFAFVSNAIPPNSTLALRTPFETWSAPATPDTTGLAEMLRHELEKPAAERIHYMKGTRPSKLLPAIREQLVVIASLLRDARSGAGSVRYGHALEAVAVKWRIYGPKSRKTSYDYNSVADVEKEESPFCFFPLQVEPEASIMSYSPWFRDQLEAVRLVSQAIPVGWKVLAKEHPSMVAHRSSKYYKRLKNMPNVRLVSPDIPVKEMIRLCRFVFCIAGTATLEAKILGKPAYCMGRPAFAPLLDGQDVAHGSFLEDFFARISRGDNRELTDADLLKHASATLPADGCTRSVDGIWKHDDSSENVARFSDYIVSAMEASGSAINDL